jgi:hypothetical protein
MSPDEELMVIFGAMHLVALVLGGVLFAMFLRSETVTPWQDREDDEEGGGGGSDRVGDRRPPSPPGDGLPLPDAVPAPVRLRSAHDHLDTLRPARRKTREPERAPAKRP